jgi:hypothetical protein
MSKLAKAGSLGRIDMRGSEPQLCGRVRRHVAGPIRSSSFWLRTVSVLRMLSREIFQMSLVVVDAITRGGALVLRGRSGTSPTDGSREPRRKGQASARITSVVTVACWGPGEI